jgi:hypothetical protein
MPYGTPMEIRERSRKIREPNVARGLDLLPWLKTIHPRT